MRRILLMTGAAFLVVLAACTEMQRGSQAHADDAAQRVRLLSSAETLETTACVHSTPQRETETERSADPARACADTELEG